MMNTQDRADRLAPLGPLLSDPDVTEIMIDGHDKVYIEKEGSGFIDVPTPFRDEEQLMDRIETIFTDMAGIKISESTPFADVRLSDGSRVSVVIPPISLGGPVLTIRKFMGKELTVQDVLRYGSASEDIIEFLRACVRARLNVVVAGGIGAGKTALLNIAATMIAPDERIIIIEHAGELALPKEFERVIRLESRPANIEGRGEVSIRDLVIHSLTMRPDRIIVGEVQGNEAFDLFQAMNTGHDGTMMTIHANSVRDVLARLEGVITLSFPSLPLLSVRQQIASALDLIVYQERLRDGSRKILKVTEVVGMQGDVIELQDIFEFHRTGVEDGKITGYFSAIGHVPKFLSRIQATGVELPTSIFTPR
jgi:pilus assembly protein CpaF